MQTINIIHLGLGNVGKEVVKQIAQQEIFVRESFFTRINYVAIFVSKKEVVDFNGIPLSLLVNDKEIPWENSTNSDLALELINTVSSPFILLDTTASDKTLPIVKRALQKGGYVVMSNKKPLTVLQKESDILDSLGKHRLFYETTVGAGLPIIHTLQTLRETGDEVLEIQGCLSGTLGYIFSELEKGKKFSMVVLDAKNQGFTEPDPRDDLSGLDVARKALILSRMLGKKMELSDIPLQDLYPQSMNKLSTEDFLNQIHTLDKQYQENVSKAKKENKVLRFLARITKQTSAVGLETIDKESDIGNLQGPDNIVVIKTKRYQKNPLIIKGPGAGIEVTATGIFGNIIDIIKKEVHI